MGKCKQLLDCYRSCDPCKRGYLDGRFFNSVLAEYPGLCEDKIVLKICEKEAIEVCGKGWQQEFEIKEISEAVKLKFNCECPDIIRVVIIVEKEMMVNGCMVKKVKAKHSNLLIVDPRCKKVFRFEP